MKPAHLILQDGRVFEGTSFGYEGESHGEVVFNTSMTGYQEILTDPSYKGQIVVMTYPEIGNYGVNPKDVESKKLYLSGFIVKELSPIVSNFRSKGSLSAYLKKNKIPGIQGIDTRALVKHLREKGSMPALIVVGKMNQKYLKKVTQLPSMDGQDLASLVSTKKPYVWKGGVLGLDGRAQSVSLLTARGASSLTAPSRSLDGQGASQRSSRARVRSSGKSLAHADMVTKRKKVIAYDFGIKQNILRMLIDAGCSVKVVPSTYPAQKVLSEKPDGVFLSNGPGDPAACVTAIENVKALMGKVPMFGICLGHQIMGLAMGAKTFKLKFGHHGGNQPVMDLSTRKVEITAQNHGFAVDSATLPSGLEVSHVNLNDQTVEGIAHKKLKAFSVQYHPEASPGPHDSHYLFERFINLMK